MRAAHDSSLCEGSLWGEPRLRTRKDFASAEARRWTEAVCQLSDCPRHPFGSLLISLHHTKRRQVAGGGGAAGPTPPKTNPGAPPRGPGGAGAPGAAPAAAGVGGPAGVKPLASAPPPPPPRVSAFFHLHLRPCVGADALALGTGEVAEAGVKVSVG